ncbi:hypothetical protein OWM54_21330 [Myxococcus sp. MISCRS1]|uniref:hypothetical protein n=1 Tax=Myxococcus TaxID=32 RepID=UPI00226EEBB6|nr:hypothetical protein [Myxococcus sp. MISCRS1]MCY0999681.1 hypothetical protein [Myxococcus sp. MISCRS1]
MTRTRWSRWKSWALAVPAMGALLVPAVGAAEIPNHDSREFQQSQIETDNTTTRASVLPPLNLGGMIGVDVTPTQGQVPIVQGPKVDTLPDPKRTKQISGEVVELGNDVLYIQEDQQGAVIPLDLQALRLTQTPREGQKVVADYQVENETQNLATALQGEK